MTGENACAPEPATPLARARRLLRLRRRSGAQQRQAPPAARPQPVRQPRVASQPPPRNLNGTPAPARPRGIAEINATAVPCRRRRHRHGLTTPPRLPDGNPAAPPAASGAAAVDDDNLDDTLLKELEVNFEPPGETSSAKPPEMSLDDEMAKLLGELASHRRKLLTPRQ